jgi:hypothetical protein
MPIKPLILISIILAACAPEDSAREAHPPGQIVPPAAVESPSATVRFDPLVISAGERVGAMTVREVQVSPSIVDGEPVGWVRFSGEVEMRGRIAPHPEGGDLDLCFFPDRRSAALLPRMRHDTRRVWLCFANPVRAREELGFEDGQAVLLLDDYRTVAERSDVVDSARLVRVLEAVPSEPPAPEAPPPDGEA